MPLDSESGMTILGLVAERIACVEILDRPDLRKMLLEVAP
jgi:hypothetical protein